MTIRSAINNCGNAVSTMGVSQWIDCLDGPTMCVAGGSIRYREMVLTQ